jgi:hypothetical protein
VTSPFFLEPELEIERGHARPIAMSPDGTRA